VLFGWLVSCRYYFFFLIFFLVDWLVGTMVYWLVMKGWMLWAFLLCVYGQSVCRRMEGTNDTGHAAVSALWILLR